ncbi:hypothetical protein WMF12_04950 [Sorangium sp. So ce363]
MRLERLAVGEVEREPAVDAHGGERPERRVHRESEHAREELRGSLLVVRGDDGVVELDRHG